MILLSWLFGPPAMPVDATAEFMNELNRIIRRACENSVSDFSIDSLLQDQIGKRRWRDRDLFVNDEYNSEFCDDQRPLDLYELLHRKRTDHVV